MRRLSPDTLPADFGRYRLTGLLGEGGMAWVFDARLIGPRGFRKPVAVKVVKADVVGVSARDVLLNEARLASSVRHPNVVDVLDVGEVDGTAFFAMERVEGVSLKELTAKRPLSGPAALEVMTQVASGLAAIHSIRDEDGENAAVVHRDLKPANVLIDDSGRARLVDFGIAVPTGQAPMDKIWGTPRYLSPEQAWGDPVTTASDVFGFGTLMFEVLVGDDLWPGQIGKARKMLVQADDYQDEIRRQVEIFLPGAGDVICRCLRAEPQDRYPDGGALFAAMDRLTAQGESDLRERVRRAKGGAAPSEQTETLAPQPPSPTLATPARVQTWLEKTKSERLRLIRGPTGSGKSRYARACVERERARGGEAVFVELDGRGGLQALYAVARALGVRQGGQGARSIAEALASRKPLLVLDAADGASTDLKRWFEAWRLQDSGTRLLVTGRRLRVRGARVLDVGVTPDTTSILADLWSDVPPTARKVLAACTAFRQGFTLDDAVAVLERGGLSEPWRALTELGDRGLLRSEGERLVVDDHWRERAEVLLSPARSARFVRAHTEHFATWGEDPSIRGLVGPRAIETHRRWLADLPNLELALERATAPDTRARLLRVLLEVEALGHAVPGLEEVDLSRASEEWRLRVDIARARRHLEHNDDRAEALLRASVDQAREAGEIELQLVATITLGRTQLGGGQLREARRSIDEAIRLAEDNGYQGQLLRAVRLQAVIRRRYGEQRQAVNLLTWCAALCRSRADAWYGARIDAVAGLVRMDLGDLDLALEHLDRAVEFMRASDDHLGLTTQLGNLALIRMRNGELRRAAALLTEANELVRRYGIVGSMTHLETTLATVAGYLGDHDLAEQHATRATELAHGHERENLAVSLANHSQVVREKGEFERARQLNEQARAAAHELGQEHALDLIDVNAVDRLIASGELDEARALAKTLWRRPSFERDLYRGALLLLEVELLLDAGEVAEAHGAAVESCALLADHHRAVWMRARARLGRALLRTGGIEKAKAIHAQLEAWITREQLGPKASVRREADRLGRQIRRYRA